VYHLKQAVTGIRRAGFMSLACIIIMTCSLLILGIFMLATANLKQILQFAYEKVEIVAFIEDDTPEARVDSLMTEILKIPYLQGVRLVNPDQAMERLKGEFGSKSFILDALDENPLPLSLEMTVRPQYRLKNLRTARSGRCELR
jgi:cell division transport system permease protein